MAITRHAVGGWDSIAETRDKMGWRLVQCLPPVSNCGTLMSFSASFWSLEGFKRHRLDSMYKKARSSSRVGRVRDDVGLGQWTMSE